MGPHPYLNKHCPVHHRKCGCHKHLSIRGEAFLEEEDESECYPAPEAAIHHNQLLSPVELLDAEPVCKVGQDQHTYHSEQRL